MDQNLVDLRKQTKQKKLKSIALLGKKTKRVTQKSDRENILSKLIKKKIGDEGMEQELKNLGLKGTDDEIEYFNALYRTKVDIRSWGFSRNLITKPLKLYFKDETDSQMITSDMLYWSYKGLTPFTNDNAIYTNFVKISKVHMCSKKAIILDNKTDINEFYFEDLEKDVFCPLYDQDFDFSFPQNAQQFTVFGKTYKVTSNLNKNVPILIAPANATSIGIQNVMNKAKKFKDKKDLSVGIKTLSKTEGSYYFQHVITVTNFCPNVMVLKPGKNGKWEFNILYEYEILPELFIETISTNFDRAENLINTITSWENVDIMYEIIAVALLINPQGNEQVRDSLTDIWESYKNNKQIIGIYRKLYMMFKRLILTFLDSFNSRISIDKMEKIRKLSTEFIDNYELINRNIDDKEKIKDFLETFGDINKMKNFLNDEVLINAKMIKNASDKILNPASGDERDLEINVRALGLRLQQYLYGGELQLFNEIRSPNAFLANTIGDFGVTTLTELIKDVTNKIIQKEWDKDQILNEKEEILDATKKVVFDIIRDVRLDKTVEQKVMNEIKKIKSVKIDQEKNKKRKVLQDKVVQDKENMMMDEQ